MKYKGVIFDLDGTLADTLEDISDSMNEVLSSKNFPVYDYQAYKNFIGNGIRNLVVQSLPEAARNEITITDCYNSMLLLYSENCLEKTRLYEGILQLVKELKQMNLKLAVLSNKAEVLTVRIIKGLFSPAEFDIILGSKPEIPNKPDPAGALMISKELKFQPSEILYIGDTDIDMVTAARAAMHPVGVTWGFRTKELLLQSGAKEIIDKPLELIDLIK